jgi:hypothetical protein
MVKRLLECTGSDFERMTAQELKESIYLSEGRTIMVQSFNAFGLGLVPGMTSPELGAALGGDLILLNGFSLDESSPMYGVREASYLGEDRRLSIKALKQLVRRPVGVYLECPGRPGESFGIAYDERAETFLKGRLATPETFEKACEQGADFIILGGNPGIGATFDAIIAATKVAKETVGDRMLIFAGKWEGVAERVLGDPLAPRSAKEVIAALIDNGADVICFSAPGSRQGITVDMIRELVEYTHSYQRGTLAMTFIDASIEGADPDTVRMIALKIKEAGADIHAIGDAGLSGCSIPENILQLSITIKGKLKTYFRMGATNR